MSSKEISYFRKECFYEFLSQTDRLSIKLTSNSEKIKLFDLFVSYFLEYFKDKKITNVIFHTTPHMAFDFIFFKIEDFLNLKKTIFFRTYYEDITLIADDYRKNNFKPITNDDQTQKVEIIKKYISLG